MASTRSPVEVRRASRRTPMWWGGLVAVICLDAAAGLEDRVGIDGRSELPAAPQVTAERSPLTAGLSARVDAQGRGLSELAGVSVRWWSRPARAQFGVGLGTVGYVTPLGDTSAGAGMLHGPLPTMTVGLRYHFSSDAALYADATSVRSLATNAMPALYNTKVGVEWQPAKSSFGFENRSLGIQLQSGYRLSLRARSGGLGLNFRSNF